MNLYDLIKQIYISIKLETNPHYYTLVDIKRALARCHRVVSKFRMERDEMEQLVYFQESLKEYLRVFSGKSEYNVTTDDLVALAMDCYNEINDLDWFLRDIESRDPNYRRKKEDVV